MLRIIVFLSALIIVGAQFSQSFEDHGHHENDIPPEHDNKDHEVVSVIHGFHNVKENHRVVQLTSFHMNLILYLEPTEGHLAGDRTPIYTAKTKRRSKKIRYRKVHHAIKTETYFFHDYDNLAALTIRHDGNGNYLIHGTIGDKAIYPLPAKLRGSHKRGKRSLENLESLCANCSDYHGIDQTHDHLVYDIKHGKVGQSGKNAMESIKDKVQPKTTTTTPTPQINDVPEVIYPQIVVIVEASLFEVFNRNIDDTVQYVLSFWNGVDLRYRAFLDPRVRLNIAGIILANDLEATPYISNNFVKVPGYNKRKFVFNSPATLEAAKIFYKQTMHYDKFEFSSLTKVGMEFDSIVIMTKHDLCDFEPSCVHDGKYDCHDEYLVMESYCQTLGTAYTTGACAYDPKTKKMEALAVVEDEGNYISMIPTAHEVGHLLGASHSITNQFHCDIDDGYIMSFRITVSDKFFKWSNCSIYTIQNFLRTEKRARCMFNKPSVGTPIARILPGEFHSRDELCERINGYKSCNETEYVESCTQLYCLTKYDDCEEVPYSTVPEGTACGKNRWCINGQCLDERETTVTLEVGTTPGSNLSETTLTTI